MTYALTGKRISDEYGQLLATEPITGKVYSGSGIYQGIRVTLPTPGNVAVGQDALRVVSNGTQHLALGTSAMYSATGGSATVAAGNDALRVHTGPEGVIAIGQRSLYALTTGGQYNIAIGKEAGVSTTSGDDNISVGFQAGPVVGPGNIAIGRQALFQSSNDTGKNVAVGYQAGFGATTATTNTALGARALIGNATYDNCTGVGYNTAVTGSNQVQLGNSDTATYIYFPLQNRSDIRDKTDVRDTVLGLDFVMKLRPVDFKWDMRDAYIDPETTGSTLDTVTPDGSKKRNRYHHGLIAQELEAVIADTGIDFGGYQDHRFAGGLDVKTVGYSELIAPMIKAIQEQQAQIVALTARLAAAGL